MPKDEEAGNDKEAKAEKEDEALPAKAIEKEDKECAELRDRLLRLAAEFDNYKKRVAKDIDESKSRGNAEVIIKLLPTVDEFEIALTSMDSSTEHTKGVALVFSNFMSALKGFGLKEIDVKGAFDPYKHEIMLVKESNKEEGTILEVVRKGYTLNGIMLRPASVIVSKYANEKEGGKQ